MDYKLKSKIIFFLIIAVFFSCDNKKKNLLKLDSANLIDSSKSIVFDDNQIRYYEKVYLKTYGDSSNSTDYAEIKFEYPEIITPIASYDSINNYVTNQILNFPLSEEPFNNIDEISDSLFSSYIEAKKEFADYNTNWFIKSNIKIMGIFRNIISIKTEESMYTGGANIFYNVIFSNFYIENGKVLLLGDIVKEEKFSELANVGKDLFYKLKNIPNNSSLENAGYWFENKSFEFNDNFAITDSGLVFFYNLYEIAPRVEGTTELFIPKERIIELTNIYE